MENKYVYAVEEYYDIRDSVPYNLGYYEDLKEALKVIETSKKYVESADNYYNAGDYRCDTSGIHRFTLNSSNSDDRYYTLYVDSYDSQEGFLPIVYNSDGWDRLEEENPDGK